MRRLITAIIDRLIESYNLSVIQLSRNWFLPLRLLYMAAGITVYIFSIIVILAVVLIVFLIVIPLSLVIQRESGATA